VWPDTCTLECPKHGSAFSLTTGEPDTLPATVPVRVHNVSVVDGDVHVELSS
jgi:3-phenylpropionate/trans-cinnamate dioxygenase ferredoxin subunit